MLRDNVIDHNAVRQEELQAGLPRSGVFRRGCSARPWILPRRKPGSKAWALVPYGAGMIKAPNANAFFLGTAGGERCCLHRPNVFTGPLRLCA